MTNLIETMVTNALGLLLEPPLIGPHYAAWIEAVPSDGHLLACCPGTYRVAEDSDDPHGPLPAMLTISFTPKQQLMRAGGEIVGVFGRN